MNYSLKKGFTKGLINVVLFALPVLVDRFLFSFPEIGQLTIGGLLVMLVNYIKVRNS